MRLTSWGGNSITPDRTVGTTCIPLLLREAMVWKLLLLPTVRLFALIPPRVGGEAERAVNHVDFSFS
jgi:hypothetical protein